MKRIRDYALVFRISYLLDAFLANEVKNAAGKS